MPESLLYSSCQTDNMAGDSCILFHELLVDTLHVLLSICMSHCSSGCVRDVINSFPTHGFVINSVLPSRDINTHFSFIKGGFCCLCLTQFYPHGILNN